MKKQIRILVVFALVILVANSSTAQASQPNQADLTSASGISSVFPLNRWSTDYIQTSGDTGSNVSIAFDDDHNQNPWISYFNGTYGSLWVAHYVGLFGGNCGPSNTWFCEEVDWVGGQTKGWFTSIDIFPDINPDPAHSTWQVGVSYYDYSNRSLKYAVYKCPLEDYRYWTVSTVDSPLDEYGNNGKYTSLKYDSTGTPHIAHVNYKWDPDWYYIMHASLLVGGHGNCGDSTDWQCEIVDWTMSIFGLYYPSLDIDWNDNIYIAYYDQGGPNYLMYAYYSGASWTGIVVDEQVGSNVGLFPSIHAPIDNNDYLRIAYYDTTNGRLKYATGPWASGNCGPSSTWLCSYIDDMGVGLNWASISLALDGNHNPVIAYTDASVDVAPLGLKLATPASGPPYGTCDGEFPDWWCGTVDYGNQYVNDGKYASLGIKANGLAMIAYSEQEREYPGEYDLKFAYQMSWIFLPVTMK